MNAAKSVGMGFVQATATFAKLRAAYRLCRERSHSSLITELTPCSHDRLYQNCNVCKRVRDSAHLSSHGRVGGRRGGLREKIILYNGVKRFVCCIAWVPMWVVRVHAEGFRNLARHA